MILSVIIIHLLQVLKTNFIKIIQQLAETAYTNLKELVHCKISFIVVIRGVAIK